MRIAFFTKGRIRKYDLSPNLSYRRNIFHMYMERDSERTEISRFVFSSIMNTLIPTKKKEL